MEKWKQTSFPGGVRNCNYEKVSLDAVIPEIFNWLPFVWEAILATWLKMEPRLSFAEQMNKLFQLAWLGM